MTSFMGIEGSDSPDESTSPGWLVAADNHNLGNSRGGSWFDPDTWGEKFDNAGKLLATGMLSGANSFYNTGAQIGSWLGADTEQRDTKAWISSIDSDMGEYYDKNRTTADLVGFIAGSLIPGIAGVKILNAGQKVLSAAATTGMIGENMAVATGLRIPTVARYAALAAQDIAEGSATFSAINANGIRALIAGVGQNVLEGVAFETAVQATMFKSPILDQQDGWDIAKNIAIGGLMGGAIGGAFETASTFGAIKRMVGKIEESIKPSASRELVTEASSPAEKIILMTEDLYKSAPLPTEENYAIKLKAYNDRIRRTNNDIRTNIHEMIAGSDSELGNMVADASHGLDKQTTLQNFLGAKQISRLNEQTRVEAQINKLAKAGQTDDTLGVSYVKLTGEDAGSVLDAAPKVYSLADKVAVGKNQTTRDAVLSEVREYKFKPTDSWDASGVAPQTGHFEAEARYIWVNDVLKELPEDLTVHRNDIPMLQRALAEGRLDIKTTYGTGKIYKSGFTSRQELQKFVEQRQEEVAGNLLERWVMSGKKDALEEGNAAIAKITNMKLSRVEGDVKGSDDFLAWQAAKQDYQDFLASRNLATPAAEHADPRFLPTYAKIARQTPQLSDVDGNIIDGMTYLKSMQKANQESVNNVVAKSVGDLYEQLPEIRDQLWDANRYGAGAGLFSSANGGYTSLESSMQSIGSVTQRFEKQLNQATSDLLAGPLSAMGSKLEASIEYEALKKQVFSSGKQWSRYTSKKGEEFLISKDALTKYVDETGATDYDELLNSGIGTDALAINNKETAEVIDVMIADSASKIEGSREIKAALGKEDFKSSDVWRPERPNPKDYPYFAFVKDPRVTGTGHTSMIFADSEAKLQKLIEKAEAAFPEYQVLSEKTGTGVVRTKREIEEFYRARDEYQFERTLHENYVDTSLKNKGIMSDFFVKTDPQKTVDGIMQEHLRKNKVFATETIRAKYQPEFDWLEDQGSAYTKVSASKLGTYSDRLEAAGKNPYLDYVKTALNISKAPEVPLLYSANKLLDGAVSKVVGQVRDAFDAWKSPLDEAKMLEINSLLDKYGMNTGYRDAATDLLVNHTAPKGELSKFIRASNAILSRLTLGMDPLNALNNAIGANILRGTELNQITNAIRAGNSDIAGKLAELGKIKLPGTGDQILSPTKLVAAAIKNFANDAKDAPESLMNRYRNMGLIKDNILQFKDMLDDITLRGTETVSQLNSKLQSAFAKAKALSETGERVTGNKFAEEFNRFISADVMRQITDPAVEAGIISKADQVAAMNTFVNRVEGVTIASQRPMVFQGPIGQAVGLFQSYQFNLMQQMFRYVAEGTKKDAAMLLGLQGTFYGMQGLPAFQFINQHVVGTLSGNTEHKDLYTSTYGIAGKEMGDLLLYGLPSNLLQTNLYSRGDINPRQVTVIPTSLPDIPIVNAYGKFFGALKDTASKISQGGNVWETLLQGIEHNGLSRPLAGLAQTMQATAGNGSAYSTDNKGSILFSNDVVSLATLSRLAGGRPLDEAIINDATYRIQAYKQYDQARLRSLGAAVKTTMINGQTPDGEAISKFAFEYAKIGGKQTGFNQFMMREFKDANTSTAQKIVSQLKNPYTQNIQALMGGGSDAMTNLRTLSQPTDTGETE